MNEIEVEPEMPTEKREILVRDEPWWMVTIKQLGLPTLLLLVLVYGAWEGATWFGTNILIPLTERQIIFINQVDESVKKITEIVEKHQENNGMIARELDSINTGIQQMNEGTKQNGQRLEAIEKVLNKGTEQ